MNTSLLEIYAVVISVPHNVYSVCIKVQNHVHACVCVHVGVHVSTITFSVLAKKKNSKNNCLQFILAIIFKYNLVQMKPNILVL